MGSETWVLSEAMSEKLEGLHMGFIIQVTVKVVKRQRKGTCRNAVAARLLKEAGTQTLGEYIDKW